jgi:hypothetical protein
MSQACFPARKGLACRFTWRSIVPALFERTPRGLTLTAAGEAYWVAAREILARVDAANRLARQIADGQRGHLRIGFVENAAWSEVVSRALREFEQAVPNVPRRRPCSRRTFPRHRPERCRKVRKVSSGGICLTRNRSTGKPGQNSP